MRKMFYPRLALSNLRNNRRFYVPYLLTCILTCAMYYNLCFIRDNDGIWQIGGNTTSMVTYSMMTLGCWVVGIFAVIFLFYTNSFLIKQRKKELGLFSILGMEKRNLARMLLWETGVTLFVGLIGALGVGLLMSKLMLLVLFRILRFDVPLGFSVPLVSVRDTALLFAAICLVNLLSNLMHIRGVSPIELMRGGSAGEREPKTNWPVAIIGFLTLGAGYYMAITIQDPLQALALFFVAVILVIIGTYCLFIAGSIALMKLLRRNKKYYYQLKHFTSLSGMMYRMRQNAAGLASICILATMVLVMISTTVCLYIGSENALTTRYPAEIYLMTHNDDPWTMEELLSIMDEQAQKQGVTITDKTYYECANLNAQRDGSALSIRQSAQENSGNNCQVVLMPYAEYARLTGENEPLAQGEALIYCQMHPYDWQTFTIRDQQYTVRQWLKQFSITDDYAAYLNDVFYIILPDWSSVYGAMYQTLPDDLRGIHNLQVAVDLDGTATQKRAYYEALREATMVVTYESDGARHASMYASIESRTAMSDEFLSLYGGLLFIGIFLGVLFVMATALIIYYKQISEGYDDKTRYEIMQKVGMSRDEVRKTVNGQILAVFFLPLLAAVMHLLFAFNMIRRLLALFMLTDIGLFGICTLCTVVVFAAAYAVIYLLTARMYYHIVEA